MSVICRFAPSPTGYLHIGSCRTALFNWLFAKHNGGKFLLRIEDTDRARSTEAAVDVILNGLKWLGLDWDGDAVFQFPRAPRHAEVAQQLLAQDQAYYCYCTAEELAAKREAAQAKGEQPRYDGRCRLGKPADADSSIRPAIRLRANMEGETTVHDQVQGTVTIPNSQLDDMILLRGDGTPTYMLAVVVDDHDMAITHVIRGDDHFTNTFRQLQIYQAMRWDIPVFAHIPMIHSPQGGKLSKRHGAVAVDQYDAEGFLPEAMCNYLLRLGWSHGDHEIISSQQAIEWFGLDNVGKSPSRFDEMKLLSLNAHYIQQADAGRLYALTRKFVPEKWQVAYDHNQTRIIAAIKLYQPRVKTLVELADVLKFVWLSWQDYAAIDGKVNMQRATTYNEHTFQILRNLLDFLQQKYEADPLNAASIELLLKAYTKEQNIPFKEIGIPLRELITGTSQAPAIHELITLFSPAEIAKRIKDAEIYVKTHFH